ncbi:MAG: glycosyltransferase family 2 protein [Deltaproteobacteria bacterium]|nr:glycosyltransferase family 2 protein [Deltaproteobacteria bacterium]
MTLHALPTSVEGFDAVEILVIDDGSTDGTVDAARRGGVKHIISLQEHRGLAKAFVTGLMESVKRGAWAIVNIDGDNQYQADDIAKLVEPIALEEVRVTIGERPLRAIPWFGEVKKALHALGNIVISKLTGLRIKDATSGFRAIRADLVPSLRIDSDYSYTIEMILRLAWSDEPIRFIPIRVNANVLRPSRLIRSNTQYILKTIWIIFRCMISKCKSR